METVSSSGSFRLPREPANYDEVSMHQSLLFSDSLKDLKNLRKQLYLAAEYFELSYRNDDSKLIVVDTLKDYVIEALVNTVDHLGSVTYKVNDLLDEKVDEVSGTEVKISSIEQRLRTCQAYMDREGLSQQSLVINTPKYHKHYILPGLNTRLSVGETMDGANQTKSIRGGCELDDQDDWHEFKNALQATIRETPSSIRNGRSLSLSPQPSQQPGNFSLNGNMSKKDLEKRTVSPHRFPLLRSGSHSVSSSAQNSRSTTPLSRSTTPISSRPTTPNFRRGFPTEPRKSTSMRLNRENHKETDHNPSKSKRLLKALLSRRKTKKDDTLYTYLDEY